MSGGRLVVLDRSGREVKRYSLETGLATIGSDVACDIRVMTPSVSKHHATISVHNAQTVVRNVGSGETLVNDAPVSVAALRHGDVITLGDHRLRWDYYNPTGKRQPGGSGEAGAVGGAVAGAARSAGRRVTLAGGAAAGRDRHVQLVLELQHRASMPASTGGKQVAIVQPQRRDTNTSEQTVAAGSPPGAGRGGAGGAGRGRPRDEGGAGRGRGPSLHSPATKASLWIHSRKSMPRSHKSLYVGGGAGAGGAGRGAGRWAGRGAGCGARAHSLGSARPVKIQPPLTIDHTKRAAIMLMTGHAKSKHSPANSPSYVIKKPSPVRKSPKNKGRHSAILRASNNNGDNGITPKRRGTFGNTSRNVNRSTRNQSATILEITDSTSRQSTISTRSSRSTYKSPTLASPKKSALKDFTKKNTRKTESIKFDLSNLQSHQQSVKEASITEDDITLHYSESSGPGSPSPRKSLRGSTLQEDSSSSQYTKAGSVNSTVASAFRTRTLSPRKTMESYSIVDLVSLDSNDSTDIRKSVYNSTDVSKSVYNSAGSANTTDFGTPQTSGRKTRSTIDPTLLGSSTPYFDKGRPNDITNRSVLTASPSTPDNTHISVNSTRVSRRSRSKTRSRIHDTDSILLDDTDVDDSPKTSRRTRSTKSIVDDVTMDVTAPETDAEGTVTPENVTSPSPAATPVLNIRSFLNDSNGSTVSQNSSATRRRPINYSRKTIGAISEPRTRPKTRGKSLSFTAKKTVLRLTRDSSETSDKTDEGAPRPETDPEDMVTPKSAVKLLPEAVKNKHSTAKKPQSKRSIIDTLNQSDMVKQLFNSPVKRKLSQSMTEFSIKHSLVEERPRRGLRHTIAAGEESSVSLDRSDTYTPERFVSPVDTLSNSPDFTGVKRLFAKNTPDNDLRRVSGVQKVLRTPRTRKSIKNDLTNVAGVKAVFARSPRNRLSDVRVKEVFTAGPENDLRRVSGVKALFTNKSPRNDLSDVRGVKRLFNERSPKNDLTNVSGVKRTLRNSPKNDLTDVRGVRKTFKNQKLREQNSNMSGIEELFDESSHSVRDSEQLFDRLVGKPVVKSVYSKSFIHKKPKKKTRRNNSLRISLDVITNNVEEWLQTELQKRLHKDDTKVTKELQRIATETVDGERPIILNRTRNSSMKKSTSEIYGAHTLPIKKRSFVETSAEIQTNTLLPIKKRVVVHSTPVKGRVDLTMNGSELGRVSPIPTLDNTRQQNRLTRQLPISEDKPIASAAKKTESHKKATPKSSQKKSVEKTPPKRTTRAKKTQNNDNTRRASLVITKKGPAMAPKHDPTQTENTSLSPKKTRSVRSTRANKDNTNITPKKTRTKTLKASVIVTKPSPKLKPRRGKNNEENVEEKIKENVQKNASNTRKTRAIRNTSKTKSVVESPKRKGRTRANATDSQPKSTGKKDETPTDIEQPKKGRKTTAIQPEQIETTVRATRGRKTKAVEASIAELDDKPRRDKNTEVKTTTTRRNKKEPQVEPQVSIEIEKKTRSRSKIEPKQTKDAAQESQPKSKKKKVESQESVQSEPTTSSRRTKLDKVENVTVVVTRKRKTTAIDDGPKKLAKKDVEQKPPLRTRNKNVTVEDVPKKQAKKDVEEKRPLRTRNKNVTVEDVPKKQAKKDVEEKPPLRTRNKNVTVEDVPKKQAKKVVEEKLPVRRGNKNVSLAEENKTVRSRRKKAEEVTLPQNVTRPVRGRKAVESKENVSQQVNNKRKQNTSDTNSSKKYRAEVASPPGRATRGNKLDGVKLTTSTGRARRR